MIVAVTGATGFVGRAITRQLRENGYSPRLLTRPRPRGFSAPAGGLSPERPGETTVFPTDFHDESRLEDALRGADALIHLIGIISESGHATFEAIHVDLVAGLLRAARAAGVRRWIQMSALGTRPSARARYHRTKWAAEELVRRSAFDWTIFRPSLIHGPHAGFTSLFLGMARWSPILPAIGGGRNRMQPIHVEQVAAAFVGCVRRADTFGRTYELCGLERLEFRELLHAILKAAHRRRLIVALPFPLARIQAGIMEWVWPRLFRRSPPLNRDQLMMLEEDNIGDGSVADATFGLVHSPFREVLGRELGHAD